MELTYVEDIKDDVQEMINSMIEHNYGFTVGVNRVIAENDYYMSSKRPIERDCHYVAIGVSTIETGNIGNLAISIKNEIKRSVENIEKGLYDNYFTKEDKKYIKRDIETIKQSKSF
jgi:hypothetical protein